MAARSPKGSLMELSKARDRLPRGAGERQPAARVLILRAWLKTAPPEAVLKAGSWLNALRRRREEHGL